MDIEIAQTLPGSAFERQSDEIQQLSEEINVCFFFVLDLIAPNSWYSDSANYNKL